VPRPRPGCRLFCNDIGFDRIGQRTEFQSSDAGSWFGGGVGAIVYVAGVNRFVKLIGALGMTFRKVTGCVTERVRRTVENFVLR
jgi:hypothetical protein